MPRLDQNPAAVTRWVGLTDTAKRHALPLLG
jgi:hypothetical protein